MGSACAQAPLTIRFLNVGQGDAVLITAPEGQTLLYDGGRSEARMRELIWQYGIHRMDMVVASHTDSDHITGLIPIVALSKPRYFINNGVAGTTDTWNRLMNVATLARTQGIKVSHQNQSLAPGKVRITLLPPPAGMIDPESGMRWRIHQLQAAFEHLLTSQGWRGWSEMLAGRA